MAIRVGIARCSKLPDYVTSVAQAGAEPVVLDVFAGLLPRDIDALVLTGGGDVDPSLYGAAAHPTFSPAEPGRDDAEIDVARAALAADLPLLAICRGVQVLNVATGGTLVQDIPSEVGVAVTHRKEPATAFAHDVHIRTDSSLARLLGERAPSGTLAVNSRHHQAPARLGAGLVVTATAPDGVIEAVEAPGQRFCVGVQWHPENFCATGDFQPLFDGLVAAARARKGG